MSYNGSGTFLINTAGQPVVSGTVISSTAFNALTADLATGLSTAITKDGQTTVTANIPMANYKFTGLGAGSGAADSANLSQVQSTVVKLLASVSGTDTITAVGSPTVAAYAAGQMFYFVAAGDNTGAVTINIDSLGAKAVTRDGSVALAAGDIKSGEVVVIVYDGTRFQVVSQLNSSGDARFANVSIASALNVGGVATVTGGSVLNGGVVINEPGADVDFRVEGDTDANLIFADASTDRVGVGTNAPGAKFNIAVSRTSGQNATALILSDNVTGAQTPGYGLQIRGTSNNGAAVSAIGFENGDVGNNNDTEISFYTQTAASGLTKQLTISRLGNLGLGVTPSAWDTLLKAIVVEDTAVFSGQTNSEGMRLGSNWYYNGGFKYQTSAGASRYDQSAGAHSWFTAASGTAGNTITFTQAMTLAAAGNLYIGNTGYGNYSSLDKSISIGEGSNIRGRASGGDPYTTIYTNAFLNSSNVLTYVVTDFACAYEQYNGGHSFNRAASGSAGGSVSLIESVRITNAGFFKASSNGAYFGSTGPYHELNSPETGEVVLIVRNTASSNPQGIYNKFSAASPDNNSAYFLLCQDSTTDRCYIYSDGDLANHDGVYGTISDQKLKQDIVDAGSQWDDLKAIRFRKYRMKADVETNPDAAPLLGVIAQELEEVCPGLVDEHPDMETVEVTDEEGNVKQEQRPTGTTTKTVKSSILLMKAAVALQEAMARIEKLEAEMAALKGA